MTSTTSIEWAEHTWNPTTGCSHVSAGCDNCYAAAFSARGLSPSHVGLTIRGKAGPLAGKAVFNGTVRLHEDRLDIPLKRKTPTVWFVDSMSDLFHEKVPDDFIDRVFAVMALTPQHTYQILTKRPERMRSYLSRDGAAEAMSWRIGRCARAILGRRDMSDAVNTERAVDFFDDHDGVLPNVWLGVSVEDQATADERLPRLLETPAAIRFVSYEPALGPVDFQLAYGTEGPWRCSSCGLEQYAIKDSPVCSCEDPKWEMAPNPDWVIVGGESGPGARPFDLAWARRTIEDCRRAGVACFVKQLGKRPEFDDAETGERKRYVLRDSKGGDMNEWPEDLRVREWPGAACQGEGGAGDVGVQG